MREELSFQEGKLLEHHETELCSPSHRFGPTVRIDENGSDVKVGGVEGDFPCLQRALGINIVSARSNLRRTKQAFGISLSVPCRPMTRPDVWGLVFSGSISETSS